jgi:HAD superfamily hydrolase (TIGR01549 family)
MKKFEALFFDLGGTLLFFDGDWSEVYAKANNTVVEHLKNAGLDLEFDAFMNDFISRLNHYFNERESELIEHTTTHILRTTLADWDYSEVPQDLVYSTMKAMYAVSQAHWYPEEDAHEMLRTFQEQGYCLAIISNAADDNDVQTLVDNANIRSYFELILSSAAVGIRKPNPRIFEIALEMMDVPNSRVAMVGDTLEADILGAQNADIYSIWITRRADNPSNRAHANTIEADMEIATLEELPKRLLKI